MTVLTIQRHSGRKDGDWRLVLKTTDSAVAHATYERLYLEMRRGGIRKLVDGTIASEYWEAPTTGS